MASAFDTVFRDILASLGHLLAKGRSLAAVVTIEMNDGDDLET